MSESTLTLEDVKAAYRLIHELCEVGADARAWRKHLQAALLPMVGGDLATAYVFRLPLDAGAIEPRVEMFVETNMNDAWRAYLMAGDLRGDPTTAPIMARLGTDFTVPRHAMIDDAAWYADPFYRRVCVPCGWDQAIYSQVYVSPPGVVDGLGIARAPGRPAFAPRDVALVEFVHAELARLWRKPDPFDVNALPPRLRQTLHGVRRGLARKEIARELGISVNTVHLYEKTLFARYGVDGRAALSARLASSIKPTLLPLVQSNELVASLSGSSPEAPNPA
jgi:DNA-binding CsgD family transcriptional regulator